MEVDSPSHPLLTFPTCSRRPALTGTGTAEIAKIPGADSRILRQLHRATKRHEKRWKRSRPRDMGLRYRAIRSS